MTAALRSPTTHYAWSPAAQQRIKTILNRYPAERKQSAVIPLLALAQDEFDGWLPVPLMQLVADTLEMPYIRVYEVATFYTMFNLKPVGKYHVQVCTNCSCMVRGSADILAAVQQEVGEVVDGVSTDGLFTVSDVECLGACVNAPMLQINKDYHLDLTPAKARKLIQELRFDAVKPQAAATPKVAQKATSKTTGKAAIKTAGRTTTAPKAKGKK